MADFTISQAQDGAAATSFETISNTFDCSEATAIFTDNDRAVQSTAALAENSPKAALRVTNRTVFFMMR